MKTKEFIEKCKTARLRTTIKNLYLNNGDFLDVYLANVEDEWKIVLKSKKANNEKTIHFSLSQVKFLIKKMDENKEDKDYAFGIRDREGASRETGRIFNNTKEKVYYKILIENKLMKGNEAARYPFSIYIKSDYIKIPLNRDNFLLFLIQAEEILENLKFEVGVINIKQIYDLELKQIIYQKEKQEPKKVNTAIPANRKTKEISTENIDVKKVLTVNEKINIAKIPIKGLKVIEIIEKLKAANNISKDDIKKSLDYLIQYSSNNKEELQYIKNNICA